jgi:hypothetical protein
MPEDIPTIASLWDCQDEKIWLFALRTYWLFIKAKNAELERELESGVLKFIESLDAEGWYDFLINKYFHWKFTAANRYTTSSKHLLQHRNAVGLDNLFEIRGRLLKFDRGDIQGGLEIAQEIPGLATAGASGLLALMFPEHFGTVDQFVWNSLRQINNLEHTAINEMRRDDLTARDGVCLIGIMREKARDNNRQFGSSFWTPRRLDMILWSYGHEDSNLR